MQRFTCISAFNVTFTINDRHFINILTKPLTKLETLIKANSDSSHTVKEQVWLLKNFRREFLEHCFYGNTQNVSGTYEPTSLFF